jgi:hypothetical protein
MEERIEEQGEEASEHAGSRLVAFVRRRPILSLGLLAGAGMLAGVDLAAGALLGLGAAALVATPAGRGFRERLSARTRRYFEAEDRSKPPEQFA